MVKRQQFELPPTIARAFIKDLVTYFVEPNQIERDDIALRQRTHPMSTAG